MSTKLTGYCEDWSCPSGISCKWHWGRSSTYAGMSEKQGRTILWKGARERDADSCDQYERDRVKPWLIPGRAALEDKSDG